ncbi:M20 metallopeptidase family protein [Vagococcus xieshaowenii]|uniref:Amidohydrolase n=1 Tax=Vagococcus xieshaowenii TaxID=2562451 RepID=A0AAJ5JM89_9ENTE|nr:M20 family metallopeptidase [Vagococcus xieshaowenii]QCA29148.1 amidohydrolase [Vagococcus xieshaowenii]TFZ40875.1 amidohydrolase [Vagococcus xieshaowenii]
MLLEETILKEAQALYDEMVANRHHLHEHPETGMDLEQTVAYVAKKLSEIGYDNIQHVGQAGLTVTVGTGEGKVMLLRGDMDALPINEESGVAYTSKVPGKMHACGHDMHTTMMLAAAKILKKYEQDIPGTVKLMFQPGEEIMKGSKDMIEHGVLENPKPDAAVMLHVFPGNPVDVGTVGVMNSGKAMASVDWFTINIKGRGGHGSMPYLAIDPLVPMAAIQNALHTLQSRELPPHAVVSVTVGDIKGCETANVIPDEISMKGTIRTYDEDHRALIKKRMIELSENIAKAFRCEAEVSFPAGAPYFESNAELVEHIAQSLPNYLGKDKFMPPMNPEIPVMGSEDFALISHQVPSTSLMLMTRDSREHPAYNLHHPKLIMDDEAMPYGAAAYVGTALSWLEVNK